MSSSEAEQDPDGLHCKAEQPLHFQQKVEGKIPHKKITTMNADGLKATEIIEE
jgi:hypothetical protein